MLRPLATLDERLEAPDLVRSEGAFGAFSFGGLSAPNKVQQRIEEGDERRIEAIADGPSSPQRLLGGDLGELLDLPGGKAAQGQRAAVLIMESVRVRTRPPL